MPTKKTKTHIQPDEEQAALNKHIDDTLHKRKVLTTTVAVITVLIVALWGFALRHQFSAINWGQSSEKQMIDQAGADWQTAQEATKIADKSDAGAVQTIKDKLIEIIAASASGTPASATGTIAQTASTTASSTP
jgi:hypothetical protein